MVTPQEIVRRDERICRIMQLIADAQWSSTTEESLVKEWGVSLDYVEELAVAASRLVREALR